MPAGGQVAWKSATATYQTATGPATSAIDGICAPANGWSVKGGHMNEQSAVFISVAAMDADEWQVRLVFMNGKPLSYPVRFEVEVTRDARPTLEGDWTALQPSQAVALRTDDFGNAATVERTLVILGGGKNIGEVELRARSPFAKITAFRLNLVPEPTMSQASPLTLNRDGECTITEIQVSADPQRTTNVAYGRPVIASGPVRISLPASYLTDGLLGTHAHLKPNAEGGAGFFYEIDLGQTWPIHHLAIKGSGLGGETVEIRKDRLGPPDWTARIVTSAAVVRLNVADGAGTACSGRWVRIRADESSAAGSNLSEVEVYPQLRPFVLNWSADARALGLREAPADSRNLLFEISAPAPSPIEAIRQLRFRIAGWHEAWREADPRLGISFPTPPPGLYQMELAARHTDGTWDAAGQTFSFTVLPAWWRSWSFWITTGAFAVIAGFFGLRQLHARKLAKQLAEAKREGVLESNRLRIARDMHDDIGARLTHLAYLADAAEQTEPAPPESLRHLASEARETVGALDQIVWAVNPRNDSVGGFAHYLSSYAGRYLANTGIRLREDIVISDPGRAMGFEVRHELMMACKEALQNIMKHSTASEATIRLTDQGDVLVVSFTDNGRGLAPPSGDPDQSGLDNMRDRIDECGGTFVMESPPGGGVVVTFSLPLASSTDHDRN